MSIINKKYCIVLVSILLGITSLLVFKNKDNNEVNNVKTIKASNSNKFAMYISKNNDYEEYQGNFFPSGYRLNMDKSKCLDNKGNEIKNMLSYEHNQVTVTSGKTSYCYLYFDEKENISNICDGTNMQECISNKKEELVTIENLSTETKGNMYRYQGLATDVDNNYICFGTNKKEDCINHPDQYMYRIIGIEESGRIKVIKKEALDQTYQWHIDYVTDVKLPDSVFFKTINGDDFLNNETYFPTEDWKDKISNNNWLYGDMQENDEAGAKQEAAGLYETETGKKTTNWYIKSTKEEGDISHVVEWGGNTIYPPGTILYYKTISDTWTDTIESKISLMYLHDYSYSAGDEAKCEFFHGESEFIKCKLGWLNLSNNDKDVLSESEWTMTRLCWDLWTGGIVGYYTHEQGYIGEADMTNSLSIRPVFYINANQVIESGLGTIDNPFIIKS